jgi:hypothetical protein
MVATRYRFWTPEDDRRLLELNAAGRSTVISAALKRSGKAVIARLNILRARAKSPKQEEAHPNGRPIGSRLDPIFLRRA